VRGRTLHMSHQAQLPPCTAGPSQLCKPACPRAHGYGAHKLSRLCAALSCLVLQAARSARVTLVGGSLPELAGGRLYNTCCVFDSSGKLLAKHR
jgi:predicted amidohydrolase